MGYWTIILRSYIGIGAKVPMDIVLSLVNKIKQHNCSNDGYNNKITICVPTDRESPAGDYFCKTFKHTFVYKECEPDEQKLMDAKNNYIETCNIARNKYDDKKWYDNYRDPIESSFHVIVCVLLNYGNEVDSCGNTYMSSSSENFDEFCIRAQNARNDLLKVCEKICSSDVEIINVCFKGFYEDDR